MKKLTVLMAVLSLAAIVRAGEPAEIRAILLHLGNNMWCDWYEPGENPLTGAKLPDKKLRTDDDLWRQAVAPDGPCF